MHDAVQHILHQRVHGVQDLPLEVVHEDNHLIVLNKAAGMVIHPGPGNYTGTLVNALLHRFGMPAVRLELEQEPEDPDLSDNGTSPLCCTRLHTPVQPSLGT